MTTLLEKVFTEASRLSEDEQNALAEIMLAELDSEKRWDDLFASSQDVLSELADEALVEHHAGKTRLIECNDE